jgi:ABC-type multidrug transport system ATPase subunit
VDVASKELLLSSLAGVAATSGAGVLLCTDELSDLEICDRVLVLVRGEVFTEFSRPPFDRDALIHATEGMKVSTRGDDPPSPPHPPTKSSSADDSAEPRATEKRDPTGQGDE